MRREGNEGVIKKKGAQKLDISLVRAKSVMAQMALKKVGKDI